MTNNCPVCLSNEGVREYIYGLPMEQPDVDKYVAGGCCLSEDMPDFRCIKCGTDFYKDKDTYYNKFISDGSGINMKCNKCQEWFPILEGVDSHQCKPTSNRWSEY